MIAAKLDLDRIAERRRAHKGDGRAWQDAHFPEPQEISAGLWVIPHHGGSSLGKLGKLNFAGHGRSHGCADQLDENMGGGAVVQGDPHAAKLAQ